MPGVIQSVLISHGLYVHPHWLLLYYRVHVLWNSVTWVLIHFLISFFLIGLFIISFLLIKGDQTTDIDQWENKLKPEYHLRLSVKWRASRFISTETELWGGDKIAKFNQYLNTELNNRHRMQSIYAIWAIPHFL